MTIRTTTIRTNQICSHCGKELLKGSKVLVKTWVDKRSMKRLYYCLDCNTNNTSTLNCTVCGNVCHSDSYPEIVFKDKDNCICENCSIDYEEVDGKVQKRSM